TVGDVPVVDRVHQDRVQVPEVAHVEGVARDVHQRVPKRLVHHLVGDGLVLVDHVIPDMQDIGHLDDEVRSNLIALRHLQCKLVNGTGVHSRIPEKVTAYYSGVPLIRG